MSTNLSYIISQANQLVSYVAMQVNMYSLGLSYKMKIWRGIYFGGLAI